MNAIILATDLSDNAINAIEVGLKWAKAYNLRPVLVHVQTQFSETEAIAKNCSVKGITGLCKSGIDENSIKEISDHLNKLSNGDLEIEVWRGNATKAIVESCQNNKAEFIVTGLKGHNIFQEVVLGSTAQRIIEHSPVPVLCVDQNLKNLPKRPLYCCDFLSNSSNAFKSSIDYSQVPDVEFDILHIINPQTVLEIAKSKVKTSSLHEAMEKAKLLAQDNVCQLALAFNSKVTSYVEKSENMTPGDQILEHAKHKGNDLIIMGHRETKGLKKFLMGSTAEYVAKRAERSILITK